MQRIQSFFIDRIALNSYFDKIIFTFPFDQSILVAAPNNDELDEKAKPPVVQQKGRFKVTSENVGIEKVIWKILTFICIVFI